jgi:integrase
LKGIDPIEDRSRRRAAAQAQKERDAEHSFRRVAEELLQAKASGWRNDKHKQQWHNTLATYVFPKFGDVPVCEVTVDHVLSALRPIWTLKPETASRTRGRIEKVLAVAKTLRLREGENPAAWRGNLENLLPNPASIQGKLRGHHPALPWDQAPSFYKALIERGGMDAIALRLCMLTAARTGEILGMRWGELDFDQRVWTVPAVRMKGGREHRQPLSSAATALLATLEPAGDGPQSFVFPGQRTGKSLSGMSLAMLLRRMNRKAAGQEHRWIDYQTGKPITVHGMRSTFRDWAGETTGHSVAVIEAQLAHKLRNKTEAAYARGDLLSKRAALMEAWAEYCTQGAS